MMRIVEFIGGPLDKQRREFTDNDRGLIVPDTTKNMNGWNPLYRYLPTPERTQDGAEVWK